MLLVRLCTLTHPRHALLFTLLSVVLSHSLRFNLFLNQLGDLIIGWVSIVAWPDAAAEWASQ